jgi:hypothetical protein
MASRKLHVGFGSLADVSSRPSSDPMSTSGAERTFSQPALSIFGTSGVTHCRKAHRPIVRPMFRDSSRSALT